MAVHSISKLPLPGWVEDLADGFVSATPWARATVALLGAGAVVVSITGAPGITGLLGAALALLMLFIAVIDSRHFRIPDPLTGAGLTLALVQAAVSEPKVMLAAIAEALLRGAILACVFLLIRYGYSRIRGRQGIGLGDVKLAGVAGAWLDWSNMPLAVEIAACAALSTYLVRQFVFGKPMVATSRLPFGLFFAPAIWICWLLESTLLASF